MLQLLKNPTEDLFMSLISSSTKTITLCAPFIKKDIVNKILNNKQDSTNLVVITSSNIASFIRKASDIEAIKLLIDNNIHVYNHQHLHAKVYSFDSKQAIITSANLTYNGLNKNYEYGILIDEDYDLLDSIADDCNCLIDDELSGEFKIEDIDFIEKQIEFYDDKPFKVSVDVEGDEKFESDIDFKLESLQSWQKDIFDIIEKEMNENFNIQQLYKFENHFKIMHPNNNNIRPKIRQILQQLRDKGLIKFVEPGQYKKLFK